MENKKRIWLGIGIVSIVAILVVCAFISMLSKKKPELEPVVEEKVPVEEEVVEEIPIVEATNPDVVDITQLSKDEFVALTWEQIRDFTELRLPNYREIYSISDETVMGEEEWLTVKSFQFYQLFGQNMSNYMSVGEVYNDIAIEKDELGSDWIYVCPTEEYINSLTDDEFATYMNNFMNFTDNTVAEVHTDPVTGEETKTIFDFHSLTSEQLAELRKEFIKEMITENELNDGTGTVYDSNQSN